MSPEDAMAFLLGKVEGDKAEGTQRSTDARNNMEAALSKGKGLDIMGMIGKLAGPLLNSLVPGLGSILGGLKGGGGKG